MPVFLSVWTLALTVLSGGAAPSPRTVIEPREQDALFRAWQKGAKPFRDFGCRIVRTDKDGIHKTEKKTAVEVVGTATGVLRYLEKDETGKAACLFLMSPEQIRWFQYSDRKEMVLPITTDQPGAWLGKLFHHHLMLLFYDMNPATIRTRFQLEELRVDKDYLYLTLKPREQKDRRWWEGDRPAFAWMRVVLERSTWRTRQLCFLHQNGDRTTWDFTAWVENLSPPVTLESLSKSLPQGWQKR